MNPKLFAPASIAVIGASDDTTKTRGKILRCAIDGGFAGPIYPVNPGKYETIQGLKAYASLDALPEVPDLLLIGIPGAGVPALIEDAARRGCGAAVVFSSDVVEPDLARAVALARRAGMSVLGPNTEGFYLPGARLAASFAHVVEECIAHPPQATPSRRRVAVVSQSGGIGFSLFGRALAAHLDVCSVVTTGNEVDMDVLDFVDKLVEDGEAGVILLFIEGLKDARRLADVAARAARRQVPMVVMKVGRSEAGQRAAVSHTAHLAGADAAYDAAFERAGMIRVRDVEELLAAAASLSLLPFIHDGRVAVITTSGGAGGWAADLLSDQGLSVPALSQKTQAAIMQHLPSFASAGNPVDATVAVTEHQGRALMAVIDILARSGEVDAVLVNMGLGNKGRIAGMAPTLAPLLASCGIPVVFHSHITPSEENLRELSRIGAHGFPSFRACGSGLSALLRYGRFAQRAAQAAAEVIGRPGPAAVLSSGLARASVLGEAATRDLLAHYAIPTPPSALVTHADQARVAARNMGYPVVLKIASPDIAHKTEAGGVELHVSDGSLSEAYERLMRNVVQHAPSAHLDGVQVQKMMPPGHELVVGVTTDPDFGPLVMLGFGGIYVEVLKDVVFVPPPIDHAMALDMVNRLKASAILKGARGRPPADLHALADFIVAVSRLAVDADGVIDQMDFNPVIVYPEGQGVVAVDALIATAPAHAMEAH